jgi:hypothetical protein
MLKDVNGAMTFEQFKEYMEYIENDLMTDPLPQGLE